MEKKFDYKGLTIYLHPEVYEPAEDTFLLLDSLDINTDDSVFEIGTGTGIISLFCAMQGANVVCSDLNPFSVELTKRNFLVNQSLLNGNFEVRSGDLFSVLNPYEKFDKIIFNPPYLPTKKDELVGGSGWFDKAVDGGADGLSLTSRFIEGLASFLNEGGKGYFVFSSHSDQKKLEDILNKNGFNFEIKNSCKFNDEELAIYRISNKK